MLRGDTEVRLNLVDEYVNAEMTWTFTTNSREEFIKKATQMWDWFMNDNPYLGYPSPQVDLTKTETEE